MWGNLTIFAALLLTRIMKKMYKYGAWMLCLLMTACTGHKTNDIDVNDTKGPDWVTLILGSYCSTEEEGIRVYDLNQVTGEVRYRTGYVGGANPSFVWVTEDGERLYSVGEEDDPLQSTGNAFRLDLEHDTIVKVNSQCNLAGAACNVILSPDGRSMLTASYGSGCITEFPVYEDGSLGEGFVVRFEGHSVNPERQDHPYLHAVNFTPDGKFLLGNDLGMDQIHVFRLRERAEGDTLPLLSTGTLPLEPMMETYHVDVAPGAGPRHLCWAPDGRTAYLLGELSGQLFVLRYAEDSLSVIQTVQADTLDGGGSADVHCSPDGRFLYASHRLKGDGISIWSIDAVDGTLTRVGYQTTDVHPRNFGISPNGRLLLCACRDGGGVDIYRRDSITGLLSPMGIEIEMSRPTCVQMRRNADWD